MKCPECGTEMPIGDMEQTFFYRGRPMTLTLRGQKCPACQEMVLTSEEWDRVDSLISDWKRGIRANELS